MESWVWSAEETEINMPSSVSNLLTPPGLVGSHKHVKGKTGDPIASIHPVPSVVEACVKTERGTRLLMPEETSRGLGVPKEWKVDPRTIAKGSLEQTTSLFHWECLSSTLSRMDCAKPEPFSNPPLLTWNEMRNKT